MAIIFELSRNPRLLEQYYQLREKAFREELGINGFDGSEDAHDRQGQILIAHRDGNCIGGCRISASALTLGRVDGLDMPHDNSCVWERFVMAPQERSANFSRRFLDHMIVNSVTLGYRYAYVLSSLRTARYYRRYHSSLGIGFRILRAAPEYASGAFKELEHYLSISHLEESRALQMVA